MELTPNSYDVTNKNTTNIISRTSYTGASCTFLPPFLSFPPFFLHSY